MGVMGHVHHLQVMATATWGKCSHMGGWTRAQTPGLLSFSFLGEDGLIPLTPVSLTGQ